MKKIIDVILIYLLLITGILTFTTLEINFNLPYNASISVSLEEDVIFGQEFYDYIEENNIKVYIDEDVYYSPYMFTNEGYYKSTPLLSEEAKINAELNDEINSGIYLVDLGTSNKDEFIDEISNYTTEFNIEKSDFHPAKLSKFTKLLIVILPILVFLSINIKINSRKNKVKILSINGYCKTDIYKTYFKEECISYSISVLLVFISVMILGNYMSQYLLLFIIGYAIVLFIIYNLILILTIKTYNPFSKIRKFLTWLLSIISLIIIAVFILFSVSVIHNVATEIMTLKNINANIETYDDYYYSQGIVTNEFKSDLSATYDYFSKSGDLVVFNVIDAEKNFINVNSEYLKMSGYEELVNYSFLVPISLKGQIPYLYDINEEEIFYYTEDIVLQNININNKVAEYYNPIIQVSDSQSTSFMLKANKTLEEYQKISSELSGSANENIGLQYKTASEIQKTYKDIVLKDTYTLVIKIFISIMVIVLFCIAFIKNFFDQNYKAIKVKRIMGYSKISTYSKCIEEVVILFLVTTFTMIYLASGVILFISVIITLLIFIISFKVIINMFEKSLFKESND